MAFSNFTVTEVTYNFTATVSTPVELALVGTQTTVLVTNTNATVSIINTRQPVTFSLNGTGGAISAYDQDLNTSDNVSFESVTTPAIYGFAGLPVSFPTGINAANSGVVFTGGLDFGNIFGTATNIISLLFAAIPIDFGTVVYQAPTSVDMGGI